MGTGLLLLAVYGASIAYRAVMSRASLRAFEKAKVSSAPAPVPPSPTIPGPPPPATAPSTSPLPSGPPPTPGPVDFSLWAEKRIQGYKESLSLWSRPPLGVLEIPKLGLVVPVLEGTDELALNRGVGHIEGTPLPGTAGNVGIAGHRDGFFRGLKEVGVGDRLVLSTTRGPESFRIDSITIVRPEDVSVLDDIGKPAVTLVTCYPFYFIGDAPQRYIVRAVREAAAP